MKNPFADILGDVQSKATPAKRQTKDEKELLATLVELSGRAVSDDAVTYTGNVFTVPSTMKGKSATVIARNLESILLAADEKTGISQDFRYHPWDTAAAVARVLDKYFGLRAVGDQWMSITASANGDKVQIPFGEEIVIPQLNAKLTAYYTRDGATRKYIGLVHIELPRRFTAEAHGVFKLVEAELKSGSIFQGKAIDANWEAPSFTDPFTVDAEKIVYTRSTEVQLSANLWSVLKHRERLTELNIPARRAVLLAGPYGTGKSLGVVVTAQVALKNGWTFIQCKPGQSLDDAFMAARLYAPAVVVVEDIDTRADVETEGDELAKILDMFDGMDRKAAGDIVVVPTTNHLERIHKGMLRPGRLDAVINVERLDAEAIERLVRVTSPIPINGDFEPIVQAMDQYTPAFIVEAVGRAVRYAIDRTGGNLPKSFTTEDLVQAAEGLRAQYELMVGDDGKKQESDLERAFKRTIAEVNSKQNGELEKFLEELV